MSRPPRQLPPEAGFTGSMPDPTAGQPTVHQVSPKDGESRYSRAASAGASPATVKEDSTAGRAARTERCLRIELPQHDPVITPGAARALLRLILKAAGREKPEPPPGST